MTNNVTMKEPERNHFTNNFRNKRNRPVIMLLGDSTIKNLSGYNLGKGTKGATVMVRSLQGGKVKNIKNLMIDMLEDGGEPDAICFHVGTNDIGVGKSIHDIMDELENLVKLTQRQGIVPVISLVTERTDKFSSKVNQLNELIIQLCNDMGVGYIEHRNINSTHLNGSGLHIEYTYTHLFSKKFVNYFDFLLENDFCLV